MVAYVHKLTLFSRSPSPPLTPRPHMSHKELNPKRPRKWVVLMGLSEASPMNTHTHTHTLPAMFLCFAGRETQRNRTKHTETEWSTYHMNACFFTLSMFRYSQVERWKMLWYDCDKLWDECTRLRSQAPPMELEEGRKIRSLEVSTHAGLYSFLLI